jgi:hypothetical protein
MIVAGKSEINQIVAGKTLKFCSALSIASTRTFNPLAA